VTVVNDKASLLIAIGCYGSSSDLFYNIGFGRIDFEMLASPDFKLRLCCSNIASPKPR
jgi:hypothetical protein